MNIPPTIWMNLTTSADWHRPAVGVVRVEQSLCAALALIVPAPYFKKCVWQDGKFVEYDADVKVVPTHLQQALDLLLPDTPAMAPARAELLHSLGNLAVEELLDDDGDEVLEILLPLSSAPHAAVPGPVSGDVIVTVGLDWDKPFSREFFKLRKKHGLKFITCCHDIIPMLYPQYCVGDVARHFKEYFTGLIWGSSGVLCFSEQSKRDLTAFSDSIGAPERPIRVVRLGDSVPNKNGEISDGVKEVGAVPFILFVSTIERRKNHEVLYRAYHHLCLTGHAEKLPKMVFVGMPGWGVGDLLKDIELDPLTKDLIVQLHHVSDAELNYLYESAQFCVYPSLYEGWGLPVAEALVYGKAILSSNQGSLPEVGGELVQYLQPWDTYAWASMLLDWIENPDKVKAMEKTVRARYVRRDWLGTANGALALINETIIAETNKPIVLLPGYDCRSNVGVHIGPAIRNTGEIGHMMYGPFWSLAPGSYHVKIFDTPSQRRPSTMHFDVVYGHTTETVLGKHLVISADDCVEQADAEILSFNFSLPHAVDEFQIRCYLFNGAIELSRVEIQRLGNAATIEAMRPTEADKKVLFDPKEALATSN